MRPLDRTKSRQAVFSPLAECLYKQKASFGALAQCQDDPNLLLNFSAMINSNYCAIMSKLEVKNSKLIEQIALTEPDVPYIIDKKTRKRESANEVVYVYSGAVASEEGI
jgi:hypothetical protein